MLAVVDASVVLKWALAEPGTESALDLLDRFEAGTLLLLAPVVLRAEIASTLARRCRRKLLSAEQARSAFRFLDQRRPIEAVAQDHVERSLDVALDLGISLWDSLYIVLAQARGCEFITADQRLVRSVAHRIAGVRPLGRG